MKEKNSIQNNWLARDQESYGRNLFRLPEEEMMDSMKEECGIFGMYSEHDTDTFSLSQFGLFALQHRGQEACGISVMNQGKIFNVKDEGLVLDVYKEIKGTRKIFDGQWGYRAYALYNCR